MSPEREGERARRGEWAREEGPEREEEGEEEREREWDCESEGEADCARAKAVAAAPAMVESVGRKEGGGGAGEEMGYFCGSKERVSWKVVETRRCSCRSTELHSTECCLNECRSR